MIEHVTQVGADAAAWGVAHTGVEAGVQPFDQRPALAQEGDVVVQRIAGHGLSRRSFNLQMPA
jgi:hypothetical protein